MQTIGLSEKNALVGEYNKNAKLTYEAVEEMRAIRAETGLSYKKIGAMFGVVDSTAARAIEGKTYPLPARMVNETFIPVNEAGLRIGEDHPNAKLTNADVERIRDLHENDGMTYKALAEKFEVSWHCIGRICRYERRAQTLANWKAIRVGN